MRLCGFLDKAFGELKGNPFCGVKIPRKLWPGTYVKKYAIDNLLKYNLPDGWRLIYTIKADRITILSVILEWMNHKDYKRRFKY